MSLPRPPQQRRDPGGGSGLDRPLVAPPLRPPIDAELRAGLAILGGLLPPTVTPDLIGRMREAFASGPIDACLSGRAIDREEIVIPGYREAPLNATVLRPAGIRSVRPCVIYLHSGGMICGDRFSGIGTVLDWIDLIGAVVVTVEYRLAPEFPDPHPREDVYHAFEWIVAHASLLGIDASRLMVAGGSSGGGLAAGLALAARDREGPPLCGQVLDYPMLDDRGETPSTRQFDGVGLWDRISNETGWGALLGDRRGGPDVSPYAAPARAVDLRRLPPAFIDCGAVEIFRDDAIDYARRLWVAGGAAELHIWGGAFHGCDVFASYTAVSRAMIQTRTAWVERLLSD